MDRSRGVAVSHWYSADNLGDLAILLAELDLLRAAGVDPAVLIGVDPVIEPLAAAGITEFRCSPWPGPASAGLLSWAYGLLAAGATLAAPRSRALPAAFRGFAELIDGVEALIPKGGGYLYSQRGLRGVLFTLRICWPLLLARRLATRRLVLGHSVGPAHTRLGAMILRSALKDATVVVRDDESAELLTRWRLPHTRAPDLAFAWAEVNSAAERPASKIVTIGITARTIAAGERQTSYEAALAASVNALERKIAQEGREARILLCPQVTGPLPDEDDRRVLRRLASLLEGDVDVAELSHEDVREALERYATLDFLVATRLHSAILASCVCVPFVVYEYIGGKARGAVRDLELPSWVVVESPESLPTAVPLAWEERAALAATMRRRLPEVERLVSEAVGQAVS